MRAAWLVFPVAVIAVALAVLGPAPRAGRVPPPLPAERLSGRATTLASLRGKPALIDFFASWCGPCNREAPILERVAGELRGRASVLGVDWSDSRRGAMTFVARYRWSFPVLADPQGAAGYAYGIQGLPTLFVLDSHGRILERLLGPQTPRALLRAVRAAARRA
ncbi:MAG: TlpA family protein disulfide reductase [Solirubrobacteraceae bacterium]